MAIIFSYQLYFMSKLWKVIPAKEPVLACDIDTRPNTKKINIIGCSNLNFNIDINEVRKRYPGVNINKYEFSGALNSCYLKYLVGKIRATGNDGKFIVYMPTDLFFHQNTFPHHPFFYQFGISRDFLRYMFTESPMILLSENWRNVYITASQHQYPDYRSVFRNSKTDRDIDSLINNKTSFSQCNFPFNRKNHMIKNPNLTSGDATYFNNIFGKENYVIINSPIPNIPEHLNYNYAIFAKCGFNKPLDPPDSVLYDSTLFYDQWYHLNNCGRTIQTAKFIRGMEQLHLDAQ